MTLPFGIMSISIIPQARLPKLSTHVPSDAAVAQAVAGCDGAYLFTLEGTQLLSIHGVHVSIPAEELGGLHPVLLGQGAAALLQQLLNGGLAIAGSYVVQHTHKLGVALTPHLQA